MAELSARHRFTDLSAGRFGSFFEEFSVTPLLQRFWTAVPLVVAAALVGLDIDLPVVRPVLALVLLVGVPTLVLHRRAGFVSDSPVARFFYAFGVSLLALIVVGFLLNLVLPVVGVDHPLAPMSLALTWLVLDLALLAWRPSIPLAARSPGAWPFVARSTHASSSHRRWPPWAWSSPCSVPCA